MVIVVVTERVQDIVCVILAHSLDFYSNISALHCPSSSKHRANLTLTSFFFQIKHRPKYFLLPPPPRFLDLDYSESWTS